MHLGDPGLEWAISVANEVRVQTQKFRRADRLQPSERESARGGGLATATPV